MTAGEERRRKRGDDPFTETGHQNVGLCSFGVVFCVLRLLSVAAGKNMTMMFVFFFFCGRRAGNREGMWTSGAISIDREG